MKRSTIILFIFIAILFILPFATIKIWMATHPEEINSMGCVSGNKDTINQVIQIEAEEIPENFEGQVEIITSNQIEQTRFESSPYCEISPQGDTLQLMLRIPENTNLSHNENPLAKITLPEPAKLFFMNNNSQIKINIHNASIQEAYLLTKGEIRVNDSKIGVIAIPDSLSIAAAKFFNNKFGVFVMSLTQGRCTILEKNQIGVAKFSGSDNSLKLKNNTIGSCSGMKFSEKENSNKIGTQD